jgi:hypothetical protein
MKTQLDSNSYQTGIKIDDEEFDKINRGKTLFMGNGMI